MKQFEAVMKVMRDCGGSCTLGHLYQEVPKVAGVHWGTRTPYASMRRIVQDTRHFFKIRPGLWALNECRDRVLAQVGKASERDVEGHSYYQGLLVQIGNWRGATTTAIPGQDRNRRFLNKSLGDIATMSALPSFGYERFVRCTGSVDVVWFNDRKMPSHLFEVEHTTDINNSLRKFTELQDFAVRFFIVAHEVRRREFESKIEGAAFKSLESRVQFWGYTRVVKEYEHAAFRRDNPAA